MRTLKLDALRHTGFPLYRVDLGPSGSGCPFNPPDRPESANFGHSPIASERLLILKAVTQGNCWSGWEDSGCDLSIINGASTRFCRNLLHRLICIKAS